MRRLRSRTPSRRHPAAEQRSPAPSATARSHSSPEPPSPSTAPSTKSAAPTAASVSPACPTALIISPPPPQGFAKRDLSFATPNTRPLEIVLQPETVETEVNVNGDPGVIASAEASGPTTTISGTQLQSLADDPDDLLRELQQLAAAAGGNPSNTTISVDGFQDSSSLPPKSSIAYIKVNPDQFSAEYREPPFDGGRVEVYTKPGQKAYHGALFATISSPWINARDPFSTSKAAISKQRYGFELTGPVRKVGSDFALTLEHRSIDNFAVVNAVTVDSAGNPTNYIANVATPQRLWLGTARLDWQLGPKNTFIASYSANVNHLVNVGVGGASLPDTGYDSQRYEHMFRLSNITTASANLMNEARLSLRWDGENDTPVSTLRRCRSPAHSPTAEPTSAHSNSTSSTSKPTTTPSSPPKNTP